MGGQDFAERSRRTLVEKNAHSGGGECAARGVFKDSASLIDCHTWKQRDKLT